MKEKFVSYLIDTIKKHRHVVILTSSMLLIVMNYFIMLNLKSNHLSFSHLMYIPIVITGTFLGTPYGLGIAILSGLAVGPIMPYNLTTGQPQFWGDWFFRLLMMASIGVLSGMVGFNYRKSQIDIKDIKTKHPDSGLYNLNYLREIKLETKKVYTVSTLIIGNAQAICEVQGYEVYYTYLRLMADKFMKTYSDMIIIQPEIHKLWLIKPTYDFDLEIEDYVKFVQSSKYVDDLTLFIDFALGFTQRKHIAEKRIANYFIQSDIAATEAKAKNLMYLTFSDINTNKQFEYELLTDFEDALSNGQIYMVYQPKMDLKTKRPIGLEALIRWEHPKKKMINPDQFIYAIEKTNMIHQMTQQVFKWSLDYQVKLNKEGIFLPISINISTKNLYDIHFYDKMVAIIKSYPKIKPSMVEFEITESLLMEDPENSKKMLQALANYGFKIAIDDFGKGYSSLAYLAQFPINTIKIDRFFTNQVLINPTTQHIVKATIDLAKQLGYEVLIEGIEDKETSDLLEKLGCHSAQGYFFKRPAKEDEIKTYLKKYMGQ
jgi:diguanylate cyclase